MKVHSCTQGEDLAAIRARIELDDGAILHIGAAGAIHFDDASEQDAYDDRVLDEAKGIRRKRNPEWYDALVKRNKETATSREGAGRPRKIKPEEGAKGGSE